MKLAILEKELQKLSDALSELDDTLKDTRKYSVPSPNMIDRQRDHLLTGIDNDLSEINGSVCGIREKIEKLKTFESVL